MLFSDVEALKVLRRISALGKSGQRMVEMPARLLGELLQEALKDRFSEAWYLERYPDVARAVADGSRSSGLHHFCNVGIFEGRIPFDIPLDEDDYVSRYENIAKAVNDKKYSSPVEHFYSVGFLEGRDFSLNGSAGTTR